jgi:predicted protein tyrosine phosphatase
MTIEQFSQWMHQPQTLNKEHIAELRKLCEEFPYFPISRMLLIKALQNSNDVLFETEIRKTATYCYDRRKLFFALYPLAETKTPTPEFSASFYNEIPHDYFSLEETKEPSDKSQSLKSLAQKLKDARLQKAQTKQVVAAAPTPEPKIETQVAAEETIVYTEEEAIRLIKAKKFESALKILRVLHLNIPEKSVYFADQIRYLEKIIATLNKS